MAREEFESPDPRDPASYPYWEEHVVRFADQDIFRHANHVAIMGLFESARVEFWGKLGLYPFPEDEGVMQVRTVVDYIGQVFHPGTVKIGSRVMRVGEKSAIARQGLFDKKGDCCALMSTVSAYVDYQAARSKPFPPPLKRFLEDEMAKRGLPWSAPAV